MSTLPYVLVTGATGFIGAHVVDELLDRGYKVRAATRSPHKGEQLKKARPHYATQLDIVQVADFNDRDDAATLDKAVQDVDAVIHVASPFSHAVADNERDLVRPAIQGVRRVLGSAASQARINRVIITSSFAAITDVTRGTTPYHTYTASDWNPQSYEESVDAASSAVVAYRGSKKFAELEAWRFVEERKPGFDLVTLCPPMTFGPVRHPVESVEGLNESNARLWSVASGGEILVAKAPFWVDVRDLAKAHVEALERREAGGKRFVVASPERFSYGKAAEIIEKDFDWGKGKVRGGERGVVDERFGLDGETAGKELGVEYRAFRDCVRDFVKQAVEMEKEEKRMKR